ncbi:MAG: chaperonin GroEL [Parachlamydiales bacterium]
MSKRFQFEQEALKSVHKGLKTLRRAVGATLGPKGRNVVIRTPYGSPKSTKDGVTVAKEIALPDPFENMGVQLVKEVASKTADVAGDGTTTAVVLAEAIYSAGLRNVASGADPMAIKRGLDRAARKLAEELDRLATPVSTPEEIAQVATISANNDPEIGAIISEAMKRVGKEGIITAGEAKGMETELEVVEGIQFDQGYSSPYFVNKPETMRVEFEGAQILLIDRKVTSAMELVPILEKVAQAGAKPLLIVAEAIEDEALATLVINRLKGGMALCSTKAPGFGERRKALLEDMAAVTGATVVSEETGYDLEKVGLEVLGRADRVSLSKEETTIVGGRGEAKRIKARAAQIRVEIENASSEYDREKLEERLAKLTGGIAVINVGAATEAAMKEKKMRVEDALHATKAAVAEGIVPGGGVALLRAVRGLKSLTLEGEEQLAVEMLRQAAFAPLAAIADNCGERGLLVAERVYEREGPFGFNGLTGQYEDLVKAGVIDPVLVTKSALLNAVSVAGLLLTTAAMIADKSESKSSEML